MPLETTNSPSSFQLVQIPPGKQFSNHPLVENFELSKQEVEGHFTRKAYLDIISTEAFRRLEDIRFLGAIDYLIRPSKSYKNRRHSRYQHSLNVGRLALRYAREVGLNKKDELTLVFAALLHDVGHGPLSHSLEPVFEKRFGVTHHKAAYRFLLGDLSVARSLRGVFRFHRIDPEEVLAVFTGQLQTSYSEIMTSPINVDTIDGILRSYSYLSSTVSSPTPDDILLAVIRRDSEDIELLDSFWKIKQDVYKHLVRGGMGLISDYVAQNYMSLYISHFSSDDFFLTEKEMRKKHADLFRKLESIPNLKQRRNMLKGVKIKYKEREFFVNAEKINSKEKWLEERYLQSKTDKVFSPYMCKA